jgi:hypothetical protein
MNRILILAALLALSGCSTLKGTFANRASCSLDGHLLLVSSMYGPIGITSKVDEADAAVVCTKAAPGPVAASSPAK